MKTKSSKTVQIGSLYDALPLTGDVATNGDQNETSESSGDETDAVEAGINGDWTAEN